MTVRRPLARFSRSWLLASVITSVLISVFCMAMTALALESPKPGVHAGLANHQTEFDEPRVFKVSEHVYVAYAYTMCNVIMVVGEDGVLIFDTGFRYEQAKDALAALRTKSEKPIRAVVYSHGHTDHTGGSRAFVPVDADPPIPVYAQENYARYLAEMNGATKPIFTKRAVAQLGLILPDGETGTVGSGGGPILQFAGTVGYAEPTHTISDELTIDLGGVEVELFHAPGDLDDALGAWIPEDGVLLSGDTVVGTHTHPILSTPRFEKGRDARAYVDTLGRMRDFPTKVLVGGHGVPIEGEGAVADLLERTEMIGQYMIDETLRLTRLDLSGPEIASRIRIPEALSGSLEFADYYHRLKWIIRGIHAKEMGWYGGDVLELVDHAPREKATRWIEALGGTDAVLDRAEAAYTASDPRWAAELATTVLTVAPDSKRAIEIKANALRAIAYASDSANERNYLLTEADVMTGEIGWNVVAGAAVNRVKSALFGAEAPEGALAAPSEAFINNFGPRIDRSRAGSKRLLVSIEVTDRDEMYLLGLREGVVLRERDRGVVPDVRVAMSHRALVLGTEGLASWSSLRRGDELEVLEGEDAFDSFLEVFDW